MRLLGDVGWIAAAMGAPAFLITYSLIAPWWRTVVGRFIFSFAAVVSLIVILAAIRLIFGPYPISDGIRAFAYVALAAVIWGAEIGLIRVQLRSRNRPKR